MFVLMLCLCLYRVCAYIMFVLISVWLYPGVTVLHKPYSALTTWCSEHLFGVWQADIAALAQREEGGETPNMSLDLPRDSFAQLVEQHAAAQAGMLYGYCPHCNNPPSVY